MKDIFGPEEYSPELEMFERLDSPSDLEDAIDAYHGFKYDGDSEDEAIEMALQAVIPLTSWDELEDQAPGQPSS